MTVINNVGNYNLKNQPTVVTNVPNNIKKLNFKASDDKFVRQPSVLDQQANLRRAIEEQQKAQKKEKAKQNLAWGLGIGASAILILALLPQALAIFRKGGGSGITDSLRNELEKSATNIKPVNTAEMPKHKRESVCEELQKAIDRIMKKMERTDIEAKKGLLH